MLAALIRWSVRHRLLVIAAWLAIALTGALALAGLPFDAFPDTTPVQVIVNATAPALGPLEVERQITMPLERSLSGLPRLDEVRSISRHGLAQVTLTFADGAELRASRQAVAERLQAVELPEGVARPRLGPVTTGLGEVFHYLVRGDATPSGLREIQDWTIAPQLRSVSGVAEINSWGGDERRLEVVVDPARLAAFGLGLDDLAHALEDGQGNASGGTLERAGEATIVQARGLVASAADVERIAVATRDGVPVLVRDVARVAAGREIRHGAVTADGKGEVVLGLGFALAGENGHAVTQQLALRLDEVRRTLPPGINAEPVYERSTLVDRVLRTVRKNLVEGALLVVAVLFIFLGDLRAGLLVALAIPLSMLFAFDLMLHAGIAGTLMSLGAIDFGLLVDSSVIVVENASRRLAGATDGCDVRDVVTDAALEVRRPTLFGELIIMVVYLPILTLQGIEGRLFRPMALTVIFALLGSMLLSLTLVPALATLLLHRRAHPGDNRVMRPLARAHQAVLRRALRARWAVVAGASLVVAAGALLATRLGGEFVPRLSEGTIVINTVRLASVSVEESVRQGTQLEKLLLASFPDEIEHVWTRTGSAEVATDPMGPELSDAFVTLTPRERWTKASTQAGLVAAMRATVATMPGMRAIFTQPIEMRVSEMVAGVRADLGVKVFGDDLPLLHEKASEIQTILRGIEGATDVTVEQATGAPLLLVDVDRETAARLDVSVRDVLDVVEAMAGIPAGTLHEGERRFPIAIVLSDAARLDPRAVGRLVVTSSRGARVPVSSVATLTTTESPSLVQREWSRRRVIVQANVQGRDIASFVEEARGAIERGVSLPPGTFVRYGGQFEHLERAKRRLLIVVPAALLCILVLLHLTYGRVLDVLRVFTGVPFAAVGGVGLLWLRGMPFSVSAAVGFVALSGVSVLADMVLVSTIRQLLDEGLALREAILEASRRRLRPVLMTALVASLGFVPMALSHGPGAEVQRPLATVVIGGVVSSTLLTLVVLPVLYAVVAGRRRTDVSPIASQASGA